MKLLTEREKMTELRRRISAALKDKEAVKIDEDGFVINNGHTMHFEIIGKDYYFKGQITKRVI
jgi:hypothetical protein